MLSVIKYCIVLMLIKNYIITVIIYIDCLNELKKSDDKVMRLADVTVHLALNLVS